MAFNYVIYIVCTYQSVYCVRLLISICERISRAIIKLHILQSYFSGVGTVAAIAALAATLFKPYINIHNLLS